MVVRPNQLFSRPSFGGPRRLLRRRRRDDRQWCLGDVLGLLVNFHDCKREIRRRGLSLEGLAEPLVRPNHTGGPSASRSTPRTVRKISAKRGRCPGSRGSARPTTGMLALKDVSKRLFADPLPLMPLAITM